MLFSFVIWQPRWSRDLGVISGCPSAASSLVTTPMELHMQSSIHGDINPLTEAWSVQEVPECSGMLMLCSPSEWSTVTDSSLESLKAYHHHSKATKKGKEKKKTLTFARKSLLDYTTTIIDNMMGFFFFNPPLASHCRLRGKMTGNLLWKTSWHFQSILQNYGVAKIALISGETHSETGGGNPAKLKG